MKVGSVARPRVLVHLAVVAMFASLLTVAFAPEAKAAAIEVETETDELNSNGECSLREAIDNANDETDGVVWTDCAAGSFAPGAAGADTIDFDNEDETYEISLDGDNENLNQTGDFDIDTFITITGGGVDETSIDGGGASSLTCDGVDTDATDRVFHVLSGGSLTLQDLSVLNGRVEDSVAGDEFGGGIWAQDDLHLDNVEVTRNILCAFSDSAWGGGISVTGGDFTMLESTVDDNTVLAPNGTARGGGLVLSGASDDTDRSTISNNEAAGGTADLGGGVWTDTAGTYVNSTISGNDSGEGGGMFVDNDPSGAPDLSHVTITDNAQDGLTVGGGTGVVTIDRSIVAEQESGDDCDISAADDVDSGGWNVSSDSEATCNFDETTDEPDSDADLGGLDDNGGPTETHLPDDSSDAVNLIDDSDCTESEDQRGEDRPDDDDDECDSGAVEHQQSEEDDTSGGGSGGGSTPDDELDATPETATNTLPGDVTHTVTVSFDESELDVDDEDQVDIKIASGPNVRGDSDEPDFECTLSSDRCSITYTGNGTAGTDVICAWMDTDDDNNYNPSGSSATDGGSCDTEPLSPSSTNDNDDTDVVNKTWAFAPTPTPTPTTTRNCSDGRDNDDDGLTDFPADPGCGSANDDTEANARPGVTVRIGTAASLFFRNRSNTFNGTVFAQRRRCLRRKVTLKHVDAGPNSTVGTDRSGRSGDFRIHVGNPNGKYYVVVKRKEFTSDSGNLIICLSARSQRVNV